MKKYILKIRENTKALILGLALFGTLGVAVTMKKTHSAKVGLAFVGLVATFKKNNSWDAIDEKSQKFVEAMDVVLKEWAKDNVDKKAVDDAIEEFRKKHEKAMLSEEQQQDFADTLETVKKHAELIEKMKDNGFAAIDVLPFHAAFMKAYTEKKDEIVAIKGNQKAHVTLSFKAAAIMGTGNITNTQAPTLPGTTVMSGLNEAPRNQPFLIDLVDTGSISTPTVIWYNKVNREDGTAFIAEGDLKPLSDFEIVGETQSVKKVATRFNVNEEMLSDVPFIDSEIRSEGVDNLRLKIDDQLLSGDGLGNNLKGIIEYASAYALPALDNTTEKANEYDAVLAVNTMLETLNFMPTAAIVHPTTRFKLRTIKDANGNYIIPPSADRNALNIDGLPVIAKNQVEAGKILIGDMKKSHVRVLMDINVRVGYNDDDFSHNRVTFLVEARLMHFIKDVETPAFVYDDLDVIKAALEAPAI